MNIPEIIRSLPAVVFIFVCAVPAVMAGICAFVAWRSWRLGGFIARAHPTSVVEAIDGAAAIEGLAEAPGGAPLVAPLTGTPCCWFRSRVEEYVRSGSSGNRRWTWTTIEEETSEQPFFLADETGRCAVWPDGADVVPPAMRSVWHGKTREPEDRNPPQESAGKRPWFEVNAVVMGTPTKRFRYTEERIHPGDRVYALGWHSASPPGEPDDLAPGALAGVAGHLSCAPSGGGQPFLISTLTRAEALRVHRQGALGAAGIALLIAVALAAILFARFGSGESRAEQAPAETAAAPLAEPIDAAALEAQALGLQERGDYAGAGSLFRQCLAERERTLGADHIDTLAAMNNLGNLLLDRGDNAEAEAIQSRCLEARQRTLGPGHPHTLASLNNLALVRRATGDFAGAEPLYRQALQTMRRNAGNRDPDTLSILNNLANLLSDMGRYAAAEPLYRELVDSLEQTLGPEHPATLAGRGNLANLLLRKGDPWAARPIYEDCLAIRVRVQGAEHPETLLALNNLAAFQLETGDYFEAERLYRQCLAGRTKVLGADHPETLAITENLARALVAGGKFPEAAQLARSSLDLREHTLGRKHPDTLSNMVTLAGALRPPDDADASKLYAEATAGLKGTLGPAHPETLLALYEYSVFLKRRGKEIEARRLAFELMTGARRTLPETHADRLKYQRHLESFQ